MVHAEARAALIDGQDWVALTELADESSTVAIDRFSGQDKE
jgi:hypothetical protein